MNLPRDVFPNLLSVCCRADQLYGDSGGLRRELILESLEKGLMREYAPLMEEYRFQPIPKKDGAGIYVFVNAPNIRMNGVCNCINVICPKLFGLSFKGHPFEQCPNVPRYRLFGVFFDLNKV